LVIILEDYLFFSYQFIIFLLIFIYSFNLLFPLIFIQKSINLRCLKFCFLLINFKQIFNLLIYFLNFIIMHSENSVKNYNFILYLNKFKNNYFKYLIYYLNYFQNLILLIIIMITEKVIYFYDFLQKYIHYYFPFKYF